MENISPIGSFCRKLNSKSININDNCTLQFFSSASFSRKTTLELLLYKNLQKKQFAAFEPFNEIFQLVVSEGGEFENEEKFF